MPGKTPGDAPPPSSLDLISTPVLPDARSSHDLVQTAFVAARVRALNTNPNNPDSRTSVPHGIQMIVDAYDPRAAKPPAGFVKLASVESMWLQGTLMADPTKGVIFYSSAGTDFSGLNPMAPASLQLKSQVHLLNNLCIAAGLPPVPATFASRTVIDYAEKRARIFGWTIEHGGHSGAASTSAWNAVQRGEKAILMDSCNTEAMLQHFATSPETASRVTPEWLKANITTIQGSDNLVNQWGNPVGHIIKVRSLPDSYIGEANGPLEFLKRNLEAHSAQNIQAGYLKPQNTLAKPESPFFKPPSNLVKPESPFLKPPNPFLKSPSTLSAPATVPPLPKPERVPQAAPAALPSLQTAAVSPSPERATNHSSAASASNAQKKVQEIFYSPVSANTLSASVYNARAEQIKDQIMQQTGDKLYGRNQESNDGVKVAVGLGTLAVSAPVAPLVALIGAVTMTTAAVGYGLYTVFKPDTLEEQIANKLVPLLQEYNDAKTEREKREKLQSIRKQAVKIFKKTPDDNPDLKTHLKNTIKAINRLSDTNAPRVNCPNSLDDPAAFLNGVTSKANAAALDALKQGNVKEIQRARKNPDVSSAAKAELEKMEKAITTPEQANVVDVITAAQIMQEKNPAAALALLQKRNQQEPGNKEIAKHLYAAHIKQNNSDAADNVISDYANANPNDAEMGFEYALILERKGDEAGKEAQMRRIAALDENTSENPDQIRVAKKYCEDVDAERKEIEAHNQQVAEINRRNAEEFDRAQKEHDAMIAAKNSAIETYNAASADLQVATGLSLWTRFAVGLLSPVIENKLDSDQKHAKAACIVAPTLVDLALDSVLAYKEDVLNAAAKAAVEAGVENVPAQQNRETNYFSMILYGSLMADRLLRNYDLAPDAASYDALITASQVGATGIGYIANVHDVYGAITTIHADGWNATSVLSGGIGAVGLLSRVYSQYNAGNLSNGDYIPEDVFRNVLADLHYLGAPAKIAMNPASQAAATHVATMIATAVGVTVTTVAIAAAATAGTVTVGAGAYYGHKRYFGEGWVAKVRHNIRVAMERGEYDEVDKRVRALLDYNSADQEATFSESQARYWRLIKKGDTHLALIALKRHVNKFPQDIASWKTLSQVATTCQKHTDATVAHHRVIEGTNAADPKETVSLAESHSRLAEIAVLHGLDSSALYHLSCVQKLLSKAEEELTALGNKLGNAYENLLAVNAVVESAPIPSQIMGVNKQNPLVARSEEAVRFSKKDEHMSVITQGREAAQKLEKFAAQRTERRVKYYQGQLIQYPTLFRPREMTAAQHFTPMAFCFRGMGLKGFPVAPSGAFGVTPG